MAGFHIFLFLGVMMLIVFLLTLAYAPRPMRTPPPQSPMRTPPPQSPMGTGPSATEGIAPHQITKISIEHLGQAAPLLWESADTHGMTPSEMPAMPFADDQEDINLNFRVSFSGFTGPVDEDIGGIFNFIVVQDLVIQTGFQIYLPDSSFRKRSGRRLFDFLESEVRSELTKVFGPGEREKQAGFDMTMYSAVAYLSIMDVENGRAMNVRLGDEEHWAS